VPVTSLDSRNGPDDLFIFVKRWLVVECGKVTSVLVIDDHPVARQGCRRVLERIGITTIFEAGNVVTGYELFGRHRPDIAVVDLTVGDNRLDGLSLIRRFNSENPKAHILVLSMYGDPNIVSRALEAGATGYILKDTAVDDLLEALQAVQVGKPYLSPDLASQVAMVRTPSRQDPLAELTPRQLQTLTLLAEGKDYSRIARDLNIGYKTVVKVSYELKCKLNARDLPQLIRTAVRLLTPNS
jgi:two-component system, NarL family, invasion response regulator UvrY